MKRDVLVASFSFEQEPDGFQILRDAGFRPMVFPKEAAGSRTEEDFLCYWNSLEQKPEGILMGADFPLGEKFLRHSQGLKAISLNCAGSDHLALDAFQKYGILAANVPRQNFQAVADFIWGQILGLMRKIALGDQKIRQGLWCEGVARGMAVSGKKLGIIGFGAVGQAVAKRSMGFDMELLVYSTSKKPELAEKYGAKYVDKETLLRESDILVPACPLTEKTRYFFDEDAFRKMKSCAVLVNAARGGIVHTESLVKALQEKRLAGAALDVYEEEPLLKSPLFDMEQVLLTPHMGGLADREIRKVALMAARNMISLLNGEKTGTELW